MAKVGRIVLIVILILLSLVVAAAVAIETRWARGVIEDQISQRLDDRDVSIGDLNIDWGFPLRISASDVTIGNTDWAEHDQMLSVDALEASLKVGSLLSGKVALGELDLQRPQVHLARREDGTTNWEALTSDDEKQDKEPAVQPDIIRVRDGEFTYQDESLDADITVTFATEETEQERQLSVDGNGSFQGQPFQLNASGGAPSEALEEGNAYPVSVDAQLGDMQVNFEGESLNVYRLEALSGQLDIDAPNADQLENLVGLLDQPGLTIPPVNMQARVQHEDDRWELEDIQARAGSSRMSGSISLELSDTPRVEADLQAERIDLNEFGIAEMLGEDAPPPADRERGADVGVEEARESEQEREGEPAWDERMAERLSMLREYAGRIDVTVDELLLGDARYTDLSIKAGLDEGRLELEQLNAQQGDGGLEASGWLEVDEDTLRTDLNAQLDQLNLGAALQPLGFGQLGTLDGDLGARFDGNAVIVNDTQLAYRNPASDLSVEATITARDLPDTDAPGMQVQGEGSRGGEPIRFDLSLGPLLDLTAPDQPYPVEGSLTAADTRAHVDGTLTQPLDFKAADLRFDISGPTPAQLNAVTGLNLPDLPGYEGSGRLQLEDQLLRLNELKLEIGESDISGDVRLDYSGRPMLWATLHSRQLRTRDVIKAAEAVDEADKEDPDQFKSADRVLDDEPLDLQPMGLLDAEVRYSADEILAKDVPLNSVELNVTLEEGILRIDPLALGVSQGTVRVQGSLNAQEPALQGDLSLQMQQVDLKPLLRSADLPQVAQDSAGILGGKGDLRAAGESIRELMGSLDGVIELAMSGGEMDMLATELVGLDVAESLVAALSDDDSVPLRCTYVRLATEDGLAEFEQFYINTQDTNFTGGGTIDFGSEELDLVIKSHPKDFSIVAVDTPVFLKGTLADPKVSVDTGSLLAKGAVSIVGALVAPPLAVLPWVERGDGESVGPGCKQALAEYEESSARE
ncbi:AsmA family protein [Halopseudomonas nanhaiensis]|uniref:AsmA family protein n=1 Tax=Halopseudomonas nanhaiensis TaxID=2830842 RepID=UPI001CBECEA6|nr:AsmA family protein [Halopseudomonas nanhaiensis]UAW99824.1 AsmA family protein [Halopseudomonas nanhaiensis]